MTASKNSACFALVAVMALLAGMSDAFVPSTLLRFSSVSKEAIDTRRGVGDRAGSLSMSTEGGTTRGERGLHSERVCWNLLSRRLLIAVGLKELEL